MIIMQTKKNKNKYKDEYNDVEKMEHSKIKSRI